MDSRCANRLASEKSPYLLQHAHNPVDWYPWSEEAFAIARESDRPVFLSIGYSTCHWCHVMAKESFEDPEVAELMNRAFISIKVDREERPDIDGVYMQVCQMMTGRGGWPLTVIMTPDRRPFFAATYIPKRESYGRFGLLDLIPRIERLWRTNRKSLLEDSDRVIAGLQELSRPSAEGKDMGNAELEAAFLAFSSRFDWMHGGFGAAPKFPSPQNLMFLLRYWLSSGDRSALDMVETTLQAMRSGGIYDQIGYGIHRYSTDTEWKVPHFEKMLYDQALVSMTCVEAYQATGHIEYASTAKEIFGFLEREMQVEGGGFASALDADSDGIEGGYYLWTSDQIIEVLGDASDLVIKAFSVERDGNMGDGSGRNVLYLVAAIPEIASALCIPEGELSCRLESVRAQLLHAREKRRRPDRDDLVLADWNGLAIAALAKGAQALGGDYAKAAARAADFVLSNMVRDGLLLHRYRETAGIRAILDDYAFMIWGLIELYLSIYERRYLDEAVRLADVMVEIFWDTENGGFYFTSESEGDLPVRRKEIYDSATPSGNAIAILDLLRLGRMTGCREMEDLGMRALRASSTFVSRAPAACAGSLIALHFALGPSCEVAVAGDPRAEDTRAMLNALGTRFLPGMVTVLVHDEPLAGWTHDIMPAAGRATAYVCRDHRCHLPTTDIEKMIELVEGR